MEQETLAEEEPYPIVFEDMPWFTCELTSVSRLSFAVADDPFYKSERAKYYPEVYLIDSESRVKAVVTPSQRRIEKNPNTLLFEYCEDFREQSLKINDDRKIRFNLTDLLKDALPGEMIVLAVKCFDLRKQPPKAGEFERSWFRIINEDTNQTIDYKLIKQIEKPEGFDENAPAQASEDGGTEE